MLIININDFLLIPLIYKTNIMNGTMIQFFHWYTEPNGYLWKEIKEKASYLAELGITAVWLPPAYKGASGGYSTGYDPYDLFDLGEFDQKGTVATKYGIKSDYLAAIKSLKDNNIQVIVDVVLNHKSGGDELETFKVVKVDPNNRNKIVSRPYNVQSYTKFTFPGRGKQYSDFQWNFTCFSGIDYVVGEEGNNIYKIVSDFRGWEDVITNERGNYDFLMANDIDMRNEAVRHELNYWGVWYHEMVGFGGVRLDALKHITPEFYKEWLYDLRATTGENIFAVGEYWAPGNVGLLHEYIDITEGCMTLFDSALHQKLYEASISGSNYNLGTILDNTLMKEDAVHAVTLTDNHDTQPLQSLETSVDYWFKPIAYALILLRQEGYPCIFYPDLFGAHYKDHGKDGNEYEIFLNKVEGIEELIKARNNYAYGTQRDYFKDANCIGWTREGDEEHSGCAILLSNKDAYNKPMEMGKQYAGKTFYDLLGKREEKVIVDENGWGNFLCPAGSVSVWIVEN